ncbi:hypothetical protein BGX20_000502 [Mortierella sp. AD010]|nr:hypothetical protein BGX20_000502 [Mortierella sp. AD010]
MHRRHPRARDSTLWSMLTGMHNYLTIKLNILFYVKWINIRTKILPGGATGWVKVILCIQRESFAYSFAYNPTGTAARRIIPWVCSVLAPELEVAQ